MRGRAAGIVILGYFALAWAGWGTSTGVPAAVRAAVLTAAGLAFLVLAVGAVVLYQRAAALPATQDPSRGRSIGRRFGIIVAVEFIGLIIIARILAVSGHDQLIAAAICLGVGIHFFPLRRLFDVPIYDLTDAVLCGLALLTAVIAPLAGWPALWTMLPGFGAAVVLYATSAVLLRTHLLRT